LVVIRGTSNVKVLFLSERTGLFAVVVVVVEADAEGVVVVLVEAFV
jgi:hypothetical protein